MSKSFQVPVLPDGTVVHYPMRPSPKPTRGENWYKDEDEAAFQLRLAHWARYQYTWQDPTPFTDTLVLLDGGRAGRSAVNFTFHTETNDALRHTVFLADFVAMTLDPRWRHGKITATFIPCKRGANYGIQLAKETRKCNARRPAT